MRRFLLLLAFLLALTSGASAQYLAPYRYSPFSGTLDGSLDLTGSIEANDLTLEAAAAPSAPTGAESAVVGLLNGAYQWKITGVTAQGETTPSAASATETCTLKKATVTWTAHTDPAVTSYQLYRTVAGPGATWLLVATVAGRSTTSYTDNTADGSLGAAAPTVNTTGSAYIPAILKLGQALRTTTTAADTLLFQAYDVDGAVWDTWATLTAGNTTSFDLNTATTLGTKYIYRADGTDVPLVDGGTNASLVASNGGIFYSTATAGAILAGTATANQLLMSGSSAAPAWSTATWPATTTINQILYSSAANTVAGLATGNSGVLVTDGSGVPSIGTDLPTAITIGTAYLYRAGGTDVPLADGGTGESLADPAADRILFWDDDPGDLTWLTVGDGLSLTTTTLALTVPGTLTVATTNASAGSHTHAVTSSSAPGAAASLLASDAGGALTIEGLTLSADPSASTTAALLHLGDNALVGGSASGTYLGGKSDGGYAGDWVNFQDSTGASQFKVTAAGALTATGRISSSAGTVDLTGVRTASIGTDDGKSTSFLSVLNQILLMRNTGAVGATISSIITDESTDLGINPQGTGTLVLGGATTSETTHLVEVATTLAHNPAALSGTPSATGSFLRQAGTTFTDNATAEAGTAALWVGNSWASHTLTATNNVTTTDVVANDFAPVAVGAQQTVTNNWAARFSGNVKITGTQTVLSADPPASATQALLRLGDNALVGGSASGTGLGMNLDAGFAGNLIDAQVNGASKLSATSDGALTAAGRIYSSAGTPDLTGVRTNSIGTGTSVSTGSFYVLNKILILRNTGVTGATISSIQTDESTDLGVDPQGTGTLVLGGVTTSETAHLVELAENTKLRSGKWLQGDFPIVDPTTLGSETLTNPNLTAGTSWTAAGDMSLAADAATYTHATASGTLTQASGALAIPAVGNRWYKFTYTVSAVTAGCTAVIPATFASASTSLTLTAGAQTTYFQAAAAPGDFQISVTSTAGAFTVDTLSLKEIQGGDLIVNGVITGGGADGIRVEADGDVIFDNSGATVNSHALSFRGDAGGTELEATLQLMQGADPYLRFSVDDDSATPVLTAVMDLKDTGIFFAADNTVDIGAAADNRPKDYFGAGSVTAGGNVTAGGFFLRSVTAGITASTTQTQGQGALTAEINEVAVCANPNDTVTLPVAAAGKICVILNNGAQTLRIFPASGDNAGAGVDTAITLAAGSNKHLAAYDGTNWETL